MSIHTFGDSHSMFGFNKIQGIQVHHLGPILCHSFGIEKLNRLNIKNYLVKDGDIVIFCFGEIDCRCHIQKHVTPDRSYTKIIDELVDNYITAIEANVNSTMKICIYNVVPPTSKYNTPENPQYPYRGTDDERKQYILYLNSKLKEKCADRNFIFFDVYDKYTDDNGFLNKKLSDGIVHILDESHIREFIRNELYKDM